MVEIGQTLQFLAYGQHGNHSSWTPDLPGRRPVPDYRSPTSLNSGKPPQ